MFFNFQYDITEVYIHYKTTTFIFVSLIITQPLTTFIKKQTLRFDFENILRSILKPSKYL